MGLARNPFGGTMHVRPLSIIVAGEDDLLRRHVLTTVLGGLGARVQEALDSWETISLLLMTGDSFDLVISDLSLLRGGESDVLVTVRAAGISVPAAQCNWQLPHSMLWPQTWMRWCSMNQCLLASYSLEFVGYMASHEEHAIPDTTPRE
jgi:hypothetical protein